MWIHHILFSLSSVDGHWDFFFYFLAVVNVTVNIYVYICVSVGTHIFSFLLSRSRIARSVDSGLGLFGFDPVWRQGNGLNDHKVHLSRWRQC